MRHAQTYSVNVFQYMTPKYEGAPYISRLRSS